MAIVCIQNNHTQDYPIVKLSTFVCILCCKHTEIDTKGITDYDFMTSGHGGYFLHDSDYIFITCALKYCQV